MAFRTFPRFLLQSTTVAQPLVGSYITAGIGAPATRPITLTLGTAVSAAGIEDANGIFTSGDWAWLIDPDGTNPEPVRIQSVSGNTVMLGPQTSMTSSGVSSPVTIHPHISGGFGTGTFIALAIDVNNLTVTYEDGATGQWMYIGSQFNFSASIHRIYKLAKVSSNAQPNYWVATGYSGGLPLRTSDLWALGTNAGSDYYNVSALVV